MLDPSLTPPPAAPPLPPAAPAPPVPPAMPAPLPSAAQFSEGGKSGGGFFSDINPTEVGMVVLCALAFGFAIYHYRSRIQHFKAEKSKDRKDIEELKSNVKAAMGENYKALY